MKSPFVPIVIFFLTLFGHAVAAKRAFCPLANTPPDQDRSISGKIIYDQKLSGTPLVQVYKLQTSSRGQPRMLSKNDIYTLEPPLKFPVLTESREFTIKNLPAGHFAVVAFIDVNDNEILDFDPPEPWGWYSAAPGGNISAVDLTDDHQARADCILRCPTPFPQKDKHAEHGALRRINNLPVLQLWGTPQERGFAHGFLLAQQILDFFEFYIIEDVWGAPEHYQETFYPFLQKNLNCPSEFIAECDAVVKGMKDSGIDLKLPYLNRDFDRYDLLAINSYIEKRAVNPVSQPSSCTQFAFWGPSTQNKELNGGLIAARNMDGECDVRKVTVSHFLLFAVDPADPDKNRWFSAMWPGFVGTITGINEDGLYSMENAGPSGPGPVVGGIVPCSWVQRYVLENASADATPQSILKMMQPFKSQGGGITASGSIILWAAPYHGQENPAFVYEGDRNGGAMRLPSDVRPFDPSNIMASNHHKVYGCDYKKPDYCFGKKVSGSTLNRYQTGCDMLEKWTQQNKSLGLEEAKQLLQAVAHGSTEHSIIFLANQKRIFVARDDLKPDAWDAPQQKWTEYRFDELFDK